MKEIFENNAWGLIIPKSITAKEKKDYEIKFENWVNLRTAFFENLDLAFPKDLIQKLDFSIGSLLLLGEYIFKNHKKEEMLNNQNTLFFDFCARYYGEVIIKNYEGQNWQISFKKREYGYLTPFINTNLSEPIGEIYRIFVNDKPEILYQEALRFETALKVDEEFKAKSKYFGLDFDQYEYMLLINEKSDFEMNSFIEKVSKVLKSATLENIDNSYYFSIDQWILWLAYNNTESIQEESTEISSKMKDLEKREKIKSCKIRIDMISTKDIQMKHFNDQIYILEAFEEFKDVFIYNPRSAKF